MSPLVATFAVPKAAEAALPCKLPAQSMFFMLTPGRGNDTDNRGGIGNRLGIGK